MLEALNNSGELIIDVNDILASPNYVSGRREISGEAKEELNTPENKNTYNSKYIVHLPGISDWLEHLKHQLACGSVNIFIGDRQRRGAPRRGRAIGPPRSFSHFDFSGPLLREGVHFMYVQARQIRQSHLRSHLSEVFLRMKLR